MNHQNNVPNIDNLAEFQRMNFFTGFFTTAEDWNAGQAYHLGKRQLHQRGLHTPGVLANLRQGLRVEAVQLADPGSGEMRDSLFVRVLPGAALDGKGNDIYLGEARTQRVDPSRFTLPATVYVSIRYDERESHYVENVETPSYSGHARISERPVVTISADAPDGETEIELARIALESGASAVSDPQDPDNPVANEIDRRYVTYAGAVAAAAPVLDPPLQARLVQVMADKRRDFAALDARFPVPSASDVRHAALTLDMLARTGCLQPQRLPPALHVLAVIERDVVHELGSLYPALAARHGDGSPVYSEYGDYEASVQALLAAIQGGEGAEQLLTLQAAASEAARVLAAVLLDVRPPLAIAPNVGGSAAGSEGTVTLDASGSQAYGGRTIRRYVWSLVASDAGAPVAAAPGVSGSAAGSEGTVTLDASGSRAAPGRSISKYIWDKQP